MASGVSHDPGHQGVDTPRSPAKRKRRFPYRKLEDLEADIANAEARTPECV